MRYDLIIVGGGLVGAGLAAALKDTPLSIALVDARLPSNADPRLFALTCSSIQFLKNIGVWSQLSPQATAIQQVHVSNQGHFGAVRLRSQDASLPSLGHVIPAYEIETALNDRLASLPNVTIFRPMEVTQLAQQAESIVLQIKSASGTKTVEAPVVIGADGTESCVRRQANIKTTVTDYDQVAIVTRTLLQRPHRNIAYERFNQHGAIAMLPLVGEECATIWTTEQAQADELMAISDGDFLQALQRQFGYRLGRLCGVRQRHRFPLRMVRAEKNVSGGVLLLGNAAHTLHPIAAQGFNLAIYEVAVLTQAISQLLERGGDLSAQNLAEISAKTKAQEAISVGMSSRLTNLFSQQSTLISCVLQLGMVGLDLLTPIKRGFIRRVVGRAGNVPSVLLNVNES